MSAYLYGSHAEGRAHVESDVDVAVLLDRDRHRTRLERAETRVRLSSEIAAALHRNEIDVVILNDAPPLLARHAVLDGIRVLCRDDAADHDFRRDVQLRAADLAPFLERMRRIKLEAVRR